jgi:nicotinamidase-related amidase
MYRRTLAALLAACLAPAAALSGGRAYDNRLVPLRDAPPILADHPEFVEPVGKTTRYLGSPVVADEGADLEVRAWRFSYNARGIIDTVNRLRAAETAVVVVHPWSIDDGQGWKSPEPAGVAMFCTPEKNRIYHKHVEKVVNPFLKALRGKVAVVAYSLPGKEDPIRKKLYRSIRARPSSAERKQGAAELAARLKGFAYKGEPLPATLTIDPQKPVPDYFRKFPGLDAGAKFNNAGFWDLPIPVVDRIDVHPEDVVVYDAEGYGPLRDFLKKRSVRHVLLAGYATDMCLCSTTAGYKNLAPDFNVFVVGDATLATFPATPTPRFATNAALGMISLQHFVTQVSWVRPLSKGDR